MTVTIKKASPSADNAAPRPVRAVSGISYPYFDLQSSIEVARVVQDEGGGLCSPDLLAAKLDYKSVRSGTYLTRISAARQFGLISSNGSNFVVTERGRTILAPVMPGDSVNAKVDAFLSVALFSQVFEQFKGQQLPPEVGLKNLFQNTYKILPDRAQQAVRVFLTSADQAGLRQADRNRLIRPSTNQVQVSAAAPPAPLEPPEASPTPDRQRGGSGGAGDGGGIHTALIGLLRELPKPGESWTEKERDDFISAFTGLIKFIFPARKGEASDA